MANLGIAFLQSFCSAVDNIYIGSEPVVLGFGFSNHAMTPLHSNKIKESKED